MANQESDTALPLRTNLDSVGARRRETIAPPREATVADPDSAGAVVVIVRMHRPAAVCSSPTTQKTRVASALAQQEQCRGARDRGRSLLVRNATSHANPHSHGCPSAPAMQHSSRTGVTVTVHR